MRIIRLQLRPLRLRASPIQLHVLVARPERLRQLRLHAPVGRDHDARGAVLLEELRHDEPCGPGADDERVDAHRRGELVDAVDRARGGLDERRFFVCEVVDFVQLVGPAARRSVQSDCQRLSCFGKSVGLGTHKTQYSANPPGERLTPIPRNFSQSRVLPLRQ